MGFYLFIFVERLSEFLAVGFWSKVSGEEFKLIAEFNVKLGVVKKA